MSSRQKKLSAERSEALFHIDVRFPVGEGAAASNVEEALARVSVENPALQAFKQHREAYHRVCGTLCGYYLANVPYQPGEFFFGVHCPRCMRDLMQEEIFYAPDSVNTSIHSEPGN
jgi:hypothetical protein